jgi:sporulation protein YlmC with PRC-barrel domain
VSMDNLIGFNLLDRQIVDLDGALVGKVDDVEIELAAGAPPRVIALLVGQEPLGERIAGAFGAALAGSARRLRSDKESAPIRIPFEVVAQVGPAITLSVRRELLTEPGLEQWLRDKVIGRIPGAQHAGG